MEGLLSMGPTPSSFFEVKLVCGGSVINGATPSSFYGHMYQLMMLLFDIHLIGLKDRYLT